MDSPVHSPIAFNVHSPFVSEMNYAPGRAIVDGKTGIGNEDGTNRNGVDMSR